MHNHNSSSIKKNSAKRQRTYDFGDIVGLKVSDVDRTNTSSTILPCKIIDKYVRNGEFIYTVATKDGIIKEHFDSLTFLDLTTANFGSLRAINIDELPTITFIQASQIYTNFKSTETCKCFGFFLFVGLKDTAERNQRLLKQPNVRILYNLDDSILKNSFSRSPFRH
ncbi:unnamed protein product [Rotaria sordida]|uniref:Uncharacterized protein n=1 Tax=Rotaria sordida TaxID=392033 RepID=A0A814KWW6_9BILA|nr:unnamed protein product [Rotaria sordida]